MAVNKALPALAPLVGNDNGAPPFQVVLINSCPRTSCACDSRRRGRLCRVSGRTTFGSRICHDRRDPPGPRRNSQTEPHGPLVVHRSYSFTYHLPTYAASADTAVWRVQQGAHAFVASASQLYSNYSTLVHGNARNGRCTFSCDITCGRWPDFLGW